MHISSLPAKYGIGTMGKEAYEFVDFLEKCHAKIWQILPLNVTSYGDSPYQSPSSLGLNYYFIDLGQPVAQTLALLSIVINEFVFAYNCRSLKEQIHKRGLFSNKYLNMGILLLMLVQLLVFFTPIGKIFGLSAITLSQLTFVILVNILSFIIIELLKPLIIKQFKDE